jgi:hypothetical protein
MCSPTPFLRRWFRVYIWEARCRWVCGRREGERERERERRLQHKEWLRERGGQAVCQRWAGGWNVHVYGEYGGMSLDVLADSIFAQVVQGLWFMV